MNVVRPATPADLAGILGLVSGHEARLSTLPDQEEQLAGRLMLVSRSFSGDPALAGQEQFLFVLEDTATGDILGTAGIDVAAGNGQPFYNYRQDYLIHASHSLGVSNRIPVLYLTHELSGQVLLCSLTLRADLRNGPELALLSRARLMFIRCFRERFADAAIVEIQGVQDELAHSPFWDSLGRHFFQMDFAQADHYSSVLSKTFIAELMPPHPMYVPLLSEAARAAINQPHPSVQPVWDLLLGEGFQPGHHIDIFDGGPVLEARTDALATVSQTVLREAQCGGKAGKAPAHLICNTRLEDFRCVRVAPGVDRGDVIRVPSAAADHLLIQDGDRVGCVLF